MAGSRYFTAIDLKSAFFQLPLDEESMKYAAFAASGTNLYEYTCLPMGCTTSAAISQGAMMDMLGGLHFNGCFANVYDVLVYSRGDLTNQKELVSRENLRFER